MELHIIITSVKVSDVGWMNTMLLICLINSGISEVKPGRQKVNSLAELVIIRDAISLPAQNPCNGVDQFHKHKKKVELHTTCKQVQKRMLMSNSKEKFGEQRIRQSDWYEHRTPCK